MSAPSAFHERVRADLDALALLAGHGLPLPFGAGMRPDVARVDVRRRRIFVGDAKHAETPHCAATRRRLTRYLRPLTRWHAHGYGVVFAVAYDDVTATWEPVVVACLADAGLRVSNAATECFGPDLAVAWASVLPL